MERKDGRLFMAECGCSNHQNRRHIADIHPFSQPMSMSGLERPIREALQPLSVWIRLSIVSTNPLLLADGHHTTQQAPP